LSNSGSYNAINCTSINNSGSYNAISCTSLNNSGSYNAISCTSLTNSGSTSLNSVSCANFTASNPIFAPSIELGPSGTSNFTYIDMKTYGSGTTLGGPLFDYDVRIGCTGGSTTQSGQGALSINCASCTIGSNLTVNGDITCDILNADVLTLASGTNITCNNITATGAISGGSISTTGAISGGSISTTGALSCGALTCSSVSSVAFNGLYRNNIKCHTIKGYSFKNTSTNVNNVFVTYPGNVASYSNSLSLTIDDACWSISILYNYYTTGSSNYQGSKQYMIIKYGDGTWITNNTGGMGSYNNYQPSFSISEAVLTLGISEATITGLTIYQFYKIEMY
jgi:hypothetical protein